MKFKMKSMPLAIVQVIASGALSALVAHPAMAQAPVSADAPQRVVVTGSLVSRADKETPSPVQVLTADDLAKSGFSSVADVLATITANGNGALSQSFSGAFATGAGGISLRGLTVGATLVLIDGHRMAPYPIGDDAQRQFVDVSNIPFDTIERIEILKDGASSVYGSDAIAGVINVILKKTVNTTTVNAEIGNSQHGGGKTKHLSVTSGIGDLQKDGYNLFGSVEYRHADAIKQYQRDNQDWDNPNWVSRGGIDLTRGVPTLGNSFRVAANTPFLYDQTGKQDVVSAKNPTGLKGVNNPLNFTFLGSGCDYTRYMAGQCAVKDVYSNLAPEVSNFNVLVGFTKKLADDWKLTTKASIFTDKDQNNRGVPATFTTGSGSFAGNTSLVPGAAPTTVQVIPSFLAGASYPGNPYGYGVRLYGYIPGLPAANSVDVKNTSYRLVSDLEGSIGEWNINASLGHTMVENHINFSGYLNRQALYDAMNRAVNPLLATGTISDADMANISPNFSNKKTSELDFAELRGSRELMDLQGGAMGLAIGASFTHKKYNSPAPTISQQGLVGSTLAYAFGKENDTAVFAEIVAPILKNLEIDVSGRADHYDTYGNSSTPKAGFKWAPIKAVTVRGTYSKGFRAPGPAENGTAGSVFSASGYNDPLLCANGSVKTIGNVVAACGFAVAGVQLTTPDIKPEKSTSKTFGLIIEPIKGWSTTIDYYDVEIKDQITSASGLPNFNPVNVRGIPLPTAIVSDTNGGTTIGIPSVGQILYRTTNYVNAGSVKTDGIELESGYKFKMGEMGNFSANAQFTHIISYTITSPDGSVVEVAGTHGPNAVGGNTGTPKNRAQLTLGYDKGAFGATLTGNWIGSFSLLDPTVGNLTCAAAIKGDAGRLTFTNTATPPDAYCHVASFVSTDLNVTYKIGKSWTLKGTILNLFDRAPPVDVGTYGNASTLTAYNPAFHQAGAVGRFFSMGANYKF